jgi:hypothetical protein
MVAKITVSSSIKQTLNYNEQKVKEGKAQCLLASGFLKGADELHFHEKLARFEGRNSLNKRAATNTVHISLNFAAEERLSNETLRQIAMAYMEKIGFADQPFLLYQHLDAGHPHLHLVTTNIQRNGRRITLHNIGMNASEKARKELEREYQLVKAEDRKKQTVKKETAAPPTKVIYGKAPIKNAISDVLAFVLPTYKYASLAELNAILKRYNILADRGKEESVMYRHQGLVYRVLNERGNKVGVPLKASTFDHRPTLSYLEARFKENAVDKPAFKKNLQSTLDWLLLKPPLSLEGFEKALGKENISLVARQNEEGAYGFTYIDHRTRCVFNGSDLGKPYSAKEILERCGQSIPFIGQENGLTKQASAFLKETSPRQNSERNKDAALALLEQLLRPEKEDAPLPFACKKQKKKRKPT